MNDSSSIPSENVVQIDGFYGLGQYRFGIRSSVPSAVIASVVPILYWRGGLLQRFGLSLVIAICVMNVALSDSYYSFVESRWDRTGRILQVIACWVSLPMLFTYSPIRTIKLRLREPGFAGCCIWHSSPHGSAFAVGAFLTTEALR